MTLQWVETDDGLSATEPGGRTYRITPVGDAVGLGFDDGVIRWQYPDVEAAKDAAEEQSTKVSRAEAWRLYMEQNDPPEGGG